MRMLPTAMLLAFTLCAVSAHAQEDKKTARNWKAKCASCHGADGKGDTEQGQKAKIADFTKPAWQKAKSDADIKKAIETGATKEGVEMEPYKDKLEPAQIDALVQYIRAFK